MENISRKSDSGFTSAVQGPNTSSDDTGHTIMMGTSYNDKFLFSNLLTLQHNK
jgi:hypothetical protein